MERLADSGLATPQLIQSRRRKNTSRQIMCELSIHDSMKTNDLQHRSTPDSLMAEAHIQGCGHLLGNVAALIGQLPHRGLRANQHRRNLTQGECHPPDAARLNWDELQ
ncbi:uncharacterized protein TRIREDRAFT_106900, partial [Trichoderma reesei QM6a]